MSQFGSSETSPPSSEHRPPPGQGKALLWENPKKPWYRRLFILMAWLLLLGCGFLAWDAHRFLTSPASKNPQDVFFTIEPGATFDRVAWDLKKNGLITDVFRFQLLGRLRNAFGSIKAGDFKLNTGWTPEAVLAQVTSGKPVLYALTLREGLTWWETARSVETQGFATYADLAAVIHDPAFLRSHAIPFANAEGLLFPETYLMKRPRAPLDRAQAEAVASMMIKMFWKKTAPLWNRLPKKQAAFPGTTPLPPDSPPPAGVAQPEPVGVVQPGPVRVDQGAPAEAAPTGVAHDSPAKVVQPLPADVGRNSPLDDPLVFPAEAVQSTPMAVQGAPFGAALLGTGTNQVSGPAMLHPLDEKIPSTQPAPAPATERPSNFLRAGEYGKGVQGWDPDGPQQPEEVDPNALRRLLIMASLVEKETGVPAERARVAGVYVNRLRRGMLLQCDPTIPYGIGESFSGAIRRSQLEDAGNPYNTYKHAGLPPGPICSSGLAALNAALRPEKHDYLYFVATGLGDGAHVFSTSLEGHNRAVQEYRARMRGKEK